ncbi:MAG: DUF3575 domain-containing protein [Flavisolibacter sp.]|nr:DUF3575 domain-containing protein [Flavisolibacter sp.]
MKNIVLLILLSLILTASSAQEKDQLKPSISLKWVPTGLIVGNMSLQGEYGFSKRASLTAKIGVPAKMKRTFQYQNKDTDFDMRAFSFLAGYRMYFGNKHLSGIYLEPYFKYVYHTTEGTGNGFLNNKPSTFNFSNEYNGVGIGAQLGVQFLFSRRFVVDLFLIGPEINSATNNFKAVEISSTVPWNAMETMDGQQDIQKFVDQFPFIRKRINLMVDKNNRTVAGQFKGALPGFRTGISFGLAL